MAALVLLVAGTGGCTGSSQKKLGEQKKSALSVALAKRLYQDGRLQEALGQANQGIEQWRENHEAWLIRGQIHFSIREYDKAIADFDGALAQNPDIAEAWSWRAWANVEKGDLQQAENDWKQALQTSGYTTPEKIYLNLGLLYFRQGREEEALDALQRSVTVNPAYSRGHYELGKAQERGGKYTKALISYEAALGGMKDSPDLNLRLALALERAGDGSRAKVHYRRVLELAPDGPEASTAREHLQRLESVS